MRTKILYALAITLVITGLFLGGQSSNVTASAPKIMEFDTMVGVPPALTGAQSPIRGINGGGLPWTVGSASGELTTGGHLEIDIQGLVFAAGPNTGANTVASFRAIVSCLKSDGGIQNISTGTFPATTGLASAGGGNARIETDISLPQPCIAPIIFVASPGGSWFAVTGN